MPPSIERLWIPLHIDDVILGCANQAGEDNRNVARMAALLAGLPDRSAGPDREPAVRIRDFRPSSRPTHAIRAGEGDALVAGGVESMTRAPLVMLKSPTPWAREVPQMADSTVGWRFVNPRMNAQWTISLGATAEKVAEHLRNHQGRTGPIRGRKPAAGGLCCCRGSVRRRAGRRAHSRGRQQAARRP